MRHAPVWATAAYADAFRVRYLLGVLGLAQRRVGVTSVRLWAALPQRGILRLAHRWARCTDRPTAADAIRCRKPQTPKADGRPMATRPGGGGGWLAVCHQYNLLVGALQGGGGEETIGPV